LIGKSLPKVLLFEELILKLNNCGLMPKLQPIQSKVWIHIHCHQRALAESSDTFQALGLIPGVEPKVLNSGCCGMAGDFGYKHKKVSQLIARQSLNSSIQKMSSSDILIATGTSCRNQIQDVFTYSAIHSAQVFFRALI
jgi:Fe-S oxidoreductase